MPLPNVKNGVQSSHSINCGGGVMSAPEIVEKLVERFDLQRDVYTSPSYNETQVRIEFIDPMFKALGWDIDNEQGYAEQYKDVVHEDAINVSGVARAPDYCFRVGGVRKFFLEAKKPSFNLKDDPSPAYQLRRYAWSAKLSLSVLTDFEEFIVYDSRVRPVPTDKASTSRTLCLRYTDYIERWGDIAGLFSREAVLKGAFDKYAQSATKKRGTAEVDDAFLAEIESWRELLARNIALRNPDLSQRELNFAVQLTIDRIIFLRICEDRGTENYGRLQALVNGPRIYARLKEILREADDRYNSGLFYFNEERARAGSPDTLTPSLDVDDKVLKTIIQNLYYPDSPYEFSVLPADILGQVYERFLGSVIRLTKGHHAVVEQKPEVRKAGGVYYTPTYIVDYIVKHTVGKLLEDKTIGPRGSASKIRILDPACGSGSFLLGAYQHLLDWHLAEYMKEPTKWSKGKNPAIYEHHRGGWRLTTSERKRILLNNIYGVDIDTQAVEVTKLSLLLKVLEGENAETIQKQYRLFHERALPDLDSNIKCGNSLIGPDYFVGRQQTLFDDEESYRVNAFDWNAEFPEIMKAGGFDAVIGNPPYGMVSDETEKEYHVRKYPVAEGRYDRYELFIARGVSLSRTRGMLGYIVPSPLLSNLYARKLREMILDTCAVAEITNFGINVFADPTVHTAIIILSSGPVSEHIVRIRKQVMSPQDLEREYDYEIGQSDLGENENTTFDIFIDPGTNALIQKLRRSSSSLGDICFIRQCIKTGDDSIYVQSSNTHPGSPWVPTLAGRSITRYATRDKSLYLKHGPWLARNWKNRCFYETPKIAVRETGRRIIGTLDLENRYLLSSLYAIYCKEDNSVRKLKYVLGVLNSLVATFYVKKIALELTKGAFTKVRTNQLARFPVKISAADDSATRAAQDRMVGLVDRMLDLHTTLANAKTDHQKMVLQRQIDATDGEIDRLVYELYDLTEEEIAILEEAAK
jgi:hypothetical protein